MSKLKVNISGVATLVVLVAIVVVAAIFSTASAFIGAVGFIYFAFIDKSDKEGMVVPCLQSCFW